MKAMIVIQTWGQDDFDHSFSAMTSQIIEVKDETEAETLQTSLERQASSRNWEIKVFVLA